MIILLFLLTFDFLGKNKLGNSKSITLGISLVYAELYHYRVESG